MKISVDGGGLCAEVGSQFGNYIVSKNLIQALQLYDQKNQYEIYTFCKKPTFIKETMHIRFRNLQPRFLWSSVRLSIEEQIKRKDVFLALNQAIPLTTPAKIISFSHGLSFRFFPKLYPDSFKQLAKQLNQILLRSHKIIVSSIKVKNELLSINQLIDTKIKVIPYGVPLDMVENNSNVRQKFFLFVGMNHPIKNIQFIQHAFGEFKRSNIGKDFKLIIANNISRKKLKHLYQQATTLLTASLYESFNLPVLEALSQVCPVIGLPSAVVPELTPYVNVVNNQDQFVRLMVEASRGKIKSVSPKIISERFSWKNYVKNLTSLF